MSDQVCETKQETGGRLDILNVGMGDLKLRWNAGDEADIAKAQATVEHLLKQGYALCIEKPDGTYARVKRFDREADAYVVSAVGTGAEVTLEEPDPAKPKRGRPPKRKVVEEKHPRTKTKATAVGPSAGG